MWKDDIVEEVRRTRDKLAARFNYDLDAIVRDLQEKQRRSGRKIISLVKKSPAEHSEYSEQDQEKCSE